MRPRPVRDDARRLESDPLADEVDVAFGWRSASAENFEDEWARLRRIRIYPIAGDDLG